MRRFLALFFILTSLAQAQPDPPTSVEREAGFLFRQGLSLLEQGQSDRASELFRKSLRLEPERLEIRPYLAKALYDLKEYEAALRQLDLYLNLEPTDAKVGLFRVKVLVSLEQYGQAADALALLGLVHREKSWEWHNLNGFLLEQQGDRKAAEIEYRRAVELASDQEFEPRTNLLVLLLADERLEEATELVGQMLSQAADDPQVLNAFALLLSKKESGFDPAPILDAVKDKTTPFELQYNLAAALAERGDTVNAALLSADLVDRFPDDARASWIYGRVLLQQKELQDAGDYLVSAQAKLPTSDETLETMGIYSYEVGDFTEAVSWFQQALKRNPQSPEVAHNLSLALSRLDRLEEAVEASQLAVELRDDDPRFLYQLAFVYDRDGRLTEAAEYYRRFLEFNESESEAAVVREHLSEIENGK